MKILDHFKSKSLIKQISLMLIMTFIVFTLVYNSLKIYTRHNSYIEVPDLSGMKLDQALIELEDLKIEAKNNKSWLYYVLAESFAIRILARTRMTHSSHNRELFHLRLLMMFSSLEFITTYQTIFRRELE